MGILDFGSWILDWVTGSLDSMRWVAVLADASIKGLAVLLIACGVSLAMRRLSGAARHLVWSAALAGLLVLPALSLVLPAWRVPILPPVASEIGPALEPKPADVSPIPAAPLETRIERHAAVRSSPNVSSVEIGAGMRTVPLAGQDPALETEAESAATKPGLGKPAAAPGHTVHWSSWILLAWFAGLLAVLAPLVFGILSVRRIARRAAPVTRGDWLAMSRDLAERLGVRRDVKLLQSDRASIPMTWGVLRPVILLPANAGAWSPERFRIVLLHELAHVRRRDCVTQLIAHLTCAVYWFNPLAWLAVRWLRVERERACDDCVLNAGLKPSEYAGHLLDIARALHTLGAAPIAAVAMARRSQFEGRLLAILDAGRSRRAVSRISGVLAVVIAAALCIPLAMLRAASKDNPSVKQAPAQEATPAAGDEVLVLRWMGFFDPSTAEQIKSAGKPVEAEDKTFQTYRIGSEAFLSALRAARTAGAFQYLKTDLDWLDPHPEYPMASTWASLGHAGSSPPITNWTITGAGNYMVDPREEAAWIKLQYSHANGSLSRGDKGTKVRGSIRFDGEVPAGESIVFLASEGDKAELPGTLFVVWQVVKFPKGHVPFVRALTSAENWIDLGSKGAARLAGEGLAWAKQARAVAGRTGEQWTHTLPHGGKAELVALGRPGEHPFRWWDPDGRPIACDPDWNARAFGANRSDYATMTAAVLRVSDPSSTEPPSLVVRPLRSPKPGEPLSCTVGFGSGPWTDASKFLGKGKIEAGGVTYDLEEVKPGLRKRVYGGLLRRRVSPGSITVSMRYSDKPDLDIGMSVVDVGGQETLIGHPLSIHFRRPEEGRRARFYRSVMVDVGDVDHFILKTRPRHFTTFSGFAAEPAAASVSVGGSDTQANARAPRPGPGEGPTEPPQLRYLAWDFPRRGTEDTLKGPQRPWGRDGRYADYVNVETLRRTAPAGGSDPNLRYLCLWFTHPQFDRHSSGRLEILDERGQPLAGRLRYGPGSMTSSPERTKDNLGWIAFKISLGAEADYPAQLGFRLGYSMGPWVSLGTVRADAKAGTSIGRGMKIGEIAERFDGNTQITIEHPPSIARGMQIQCTALTKDGVARNATRIHGGGSSQTFQFETSLADVAEFQLRTRPMHEATYRDVPILTKGVDRPSNSQPIERPAAGGYQPVIERILRRAPDDDSVIGFGSGALYKPPPGTTPDDDPEGMLAWFRANGVDAYCEAFQGDRGLKGYEMIAVSIPNDQFDAITPDQLRNRIGRSEPAPPSVEIRSESLPATFIFRTREQAKGVLQIIGPAAPAGPAGIEPPPRGLKIRYKLVVPTLREQLHGIDSLRSRTTPYDRVEAIAAGLLQKYEDPADQGQILYTVAHVYGQTGMTRPERLIEYVQRALEKPLDLKDRLRLHTYWGGAHWIRIREFAPERQAQERRNAAVAYLKGLRLVLEEDLPAKPPELPGVNRYTFGDPEAAREVREEHERQVAARRKAERERDLIQERQVLTGQIVSLYGKYGDDTLRELHELALKHLGDDEAASRLVDAVRARRQNRQAPVPVLSPLRKKPTVEPAPADEARAGAQSGFHPAVEFVVHEVPGDDSLIDFDTLELSKRAADLGPEDDLKAIRARFLTSGVDARCRAFRGVPGLVGYDMIAVPVANEEFDRITNDTVRSRIGQNEPAPPSVEIRSENLPATFVFRTREQAKGVLQIMRPAAPAGSPGTGPSPRGLKIRYKLVVPTLPEQLRGIDSLRAEKTPYDRVEAMAAGLLQKYNDPADQGRILYMVAEVYAQTGHKRPERLFEYIQRALEKPLDLKDRLQLYIYWGDGHWLRIRKFAPDRRGEERRRSAEAYLTGLREVLREDLPARPPELPGVGPRGRIVGNPEALQAARERLARQMAARKKAQRQRELIQQRQVLTGQIVGLYVDHGDETLNELFELAREYFGNHEAPYLLVDAVRARREKRPASVPVLHRLWKEPTVEPAPADEATAGGGFHPAVEFAVHEPPGDDSLFDFDTLGFTTPTAALDPNDDPETMVTRFRATGVDVYCAASPGGPRLIGYDMIAVPVASEEFDRLPAGRVRNLIDQNEPASTTVEIRSDRLPATFVFRTHEQTKGIFQLVARSDLPGPAGDASLPIRGLKIRCKPVVPTLRERLMGMNSLRYFGNTPYDRLETMAGKFLTEHQDPAEQGRIQYMAAHVYAQTGIGRNSGKVIEWVQKALEKPLDLKDRLQLYIYWGDAHYVRIGEVSPDRREAERRRSVAAYLTGLREVLREDLPAQPPELPGVGRGPRIRGYGDDEASRAARNKAIRQRALIQQRQILTGQVVNLYVQYRDDTLNELHELALKHLANEEAAYRLIDAVRARREKRQAPLPVLPRLGKEPTTEPAPADEVTTGVRRVFLPDGADTPGDEDVLDLATGKFLPFSGDDVAHFTRLGKGDVAYDHRDDLICLRGATASLCEDGKAQPLEPERQMGDARRYRLPAYPCRLLITTAKGVRYDLTVLSTERRGIHLEYRRSTAGSAVGGRAEKPGQPRNYEAMSFNELLDHYQALILELEAEKAAYRKSQPIFAKLDHALKNVAVPLMKRAELARLRYVSVFPTLPKKQQDMIVENQKGFDEKPAIDSLIWSIYKDIAPEAQKIAAPDGENVQWLTRLILTLGNVPTVDNPLAFAIPFETGSWEADGFYTNLGEPLQMVTGIVCQAVVSGLPRELKEKEQLVKRVHELLKSKAGPEERGSLPPQYKDSFWSAYESSYGEVQALTDAFWEAKRRGEAPPEKILAEMSKTVEAEITRLAGRGDTGDTGPRPGGKIEPGSLDLTAGVFTRPISIRLDDTPLQDAFCLIARLSRLNIVLNPDRVKGNVTAELKNVPVGTALKQILGSHNLVLAVDAPGVYRVTPGGEIGVADTEAPGGTALDLSDGLLRKRVSLTFQSADLQDVVGHLARHADLNIAMKTDGVRRPVTVEMTEVPVGHILTSVLRAHDLGLVRDEPGVYRVVPKGNALLDATTPDSEEIIPIPIPSPVAGGTRTILLPDAEDAPDEDCVLDLATGELLPFTGGPEDCTRLGRGDLFYFREEGFLFLRGAAANLWNGEMAQPLEPARHHADVRAYELPEYPCRLLITTAEGVQYDVTVQAPKRRGVQLEYAPTGTRGEATQEANAVAQIKSLLVACGNYAADHQWQWPPDLQTLVTEAYVKPPADIDLGAEYAFVPFDPATTEPGVADDTVVLFQRYSGWEAALPVGYSDGTAAWLTDREKVKTLIDAENARAREEARRRMQELLAPYKALSYTDLLSSYTALVAELEAETAAYRASQPVFARFERTIRDVTIPLCKRGYLDRQRYKIAYPKRPQEYWDTLEKNLNRADVTQALMSLIWSIYKDVALEARKIAVPDSKEGRALREFIASFQNSPTVDNPLEFKIPFEKDSGEYYWYCAYVTEAHQDPPEIIWNALANALPKELREKEDLAFRVRLLLGGKADPEQAKALPPKYEDPYRKRNTYWRLLEDFQAFVEAYSKAAKRGDKPPEEILDEFSKTVEAEIERLIGRAGSEGAARGTVGVTTTASREEIPAEKSNNARAAKARSQIEALLVACKMYASDHKGEWPTNLKTLVKNGYMKPVAGMNIDVYSRKTKDLAVGFSDGESEPIRDRTGFMQLFGADATTRTRSGVERESPDFPTDVFTKKISANFDKVPLQSALCLMARLTGLNVVMNSVDAKGTVSSEFIDVSVWKALRETLRSHDLILVSDAPGVYRVAPRTEAGLAGDASPPNGKAVDPSDNLLQKKISLSFQNADPRAAVRIIARHAELSVAIDAGNQYRPLTVELNDVPVGAVLKSILLTQNLDLVRDAPGVYRGVPRTAADVPGDTTGTPGL